MKKLFCFLLILIVLALAFVGIAGGYLYSRRVSMLSEYLSQKMGVKVTVQAIELGKEKILIRNLDIANPKGYTMPTAFHAETITFDAPLTHYLEKNIVIDNVILKNVYLGIEFKDKNHTQGNWTDIIANFDTNYSSTKAPESQKSTKEKSFRSSRHVLIKKLLFINVSVALKLYGDSSPRQLSPIAQIELDNVNSEEGMPTEEITEIIIQKLMQEASLLKGFSNMIINAPGKAVKTALSPFSIFFGGKDE